MFHKWLVGRHGTMTMGFMGCLMIRIKRVNFLHPLPLSPLYTYPSEKYESHLGQKFPTKWKMKHVPNHQPAFVGLLMINGKSGKQLLFALIDFECFLMVDDRQWHGISHIIAKDKELTLFGLFLAERMGKLIWKNGSYFVTVFVVIIALLNIRNYDDWSWKDCVTSRAPFVPPFLGGVPGDVSKC